METAPATTGADLPAPPASARRARRRRAFGRVFKRPGGPGWLIQYPDQTGRKARSGRTAYVTRSVRDRAEGEALLKEVRLAILRGAYAPTGAREATPAPDTTKMTLKEAVAAFIEAKRGEARSPATVVMYEGTLRVLERHGIAGRPVAGITPSDVERYLNWRRENVWRSVSQRGGRIVSMRVPGGVASKSTLARDREILCASYNRLRKLGLIATNPVAAVPKPKRPRGKRAVLSKSEVARLIDACDRWTRPIVLTAFYTGMRKREILRLNWSDVDFEARRLAVYRPKVGNFSWLPMHPVLAGELRQVHERRRRPDSSPPPADEAVFFTRLGKPCRCFRGGWQAAVRRAGLADREGVTPHCARHTFACHFLDHGAAVTDLSEVLGHASLQTTQIYARMVDRRTRESVEAMDFGA